MSITAHENSNYSRPRASVDMSLPSSYQRSQSHNNYDYQEVSTSGLREDSGFKDSPFSNSSASSAPKEDTPPPIRLDKHPSFRKQRSNPCRVPRSAASSRCSTSPSERSGSFTGRSQSYGQSVGSFNDEELFDERAMTSSSRQSGTPPDEGYSENDESGSGQFRMDPEVATEMYETMRHPGTQEEYIKMIPAFTSGMTLPRPAVPSHYDVPPPFRKRSVPNGDQSNSSSASPSNYENCATLPTIQEAPKQRQHSLDVYENFPAAVRTKNEDFTHYHPTYENMEAVHEQRRNLESYQNITLIDDKQKRASIRKSQSMEEREGSSTPPTGQLHLHYAQRHSPVSDTPPLPPRIPVVQTTTTVV